jgi:hypothetical protein
MKKTLIFLCQVGLISATSASGLGTCLYSEKEIQQARQNIEQMPAARAVQERLLSDVKPWLALDDPRISSGAASAKSSDLLSLAQAYLLTADPIYAHKAAILSTALLNSISKTMNLGWTAICRAKKEMRILVHFLNPGRSAI